MAGGNGRREPNAPQGKFSGFRFSIPSLPKEWYQTIQQAREVWGLSQWQVVILALAALKGMSVASPDHMKELAEQVRENYSGE